MVEAALWCGHVWLPTEGLRCRWLTADRSSRKEIEYSLTAKSVAWSQPSRDGLRDTEDPLANGNWRSGRASSGRSWWCPLAPDFRQSLGKGFSSKYQTLWLHLVSIFETLLLTWFYFLNDEWRVCCETSEVEAESLHFYHSFIVLFCFLTFPRVQILLNLTVKCSVSLLICGKAFGSCWSLFFGSWIVSEDMDMTKCFLLCDALPGLLTAASVVFLWGLYAFTFVCSEMKSSSTRLGSGVWLGRCSTFQFFAFRNSWVSLAVCFDYQPCILWCTVLFTLPHLAESEQTVRPSTLRSSAGCFSLLSHHQ